ncbi:hypothetical protein [Nostoc sp. NZL]|uniref:hypothetical protein n=1 Tax=Nostoc sp. NZL TaxID=2650612 RepID=UPI0018C5F6B2|nr:hypothetical protein [Nostoc sp. NZL]MBG1239893.1 hypothetical protein [Nostoc sp. NZL]
MSKQKPYTIFWFWLKVTLSVFFFLSAMNLLLLVLFSFLRVPSFVIGNDTFWLLRWQYEPGASFVIAFNPLVLISIAAVIGFIGIWWKQKPKQHRRKTR